jgi:hypothetical protein
VDKQVGFRLPEALVERLDRYAEARARELGLEVTRTDAARMLLTAALDSAEGGAGKARSKKD